MNMSVKWYVQYYSGSVWVRAARVNSHTACSDIMCDLCVHFVIIHVIMYCNQLYIIFQEAGIT